MDKGTEFLTADGSLSLDITVMEMMNIVAIVFIQGRAPDWQDFVGIAVLLIINSKSMLIEKLEEDYQFPLPLSGEAIKLPAIPELLPPENPGFLDTQFSNLGRTDWVLFNKFDELEEEFNRGSDKTLKDLPAKDIDTGMGFVLKAKQGFFRTFCRNLLNLPSMPMVTNYLTLIAGLVILFSPAATAVDPGSYNLEVSSYVSQVGGVPMSMSPTFSQLHFDTWALKLFGMAMGMLVAFGLAAAEPGTSITSTGLGKPALLKGRDRYTKPRKTSS